jgi:hypothetical protein
MKPQKEERMPGSAFFFVPFLSGLVLTVLLRMIFRRGGLWAALVGLVTAVGFLLDAYFSASASYQCYDCELYLGRYWEPQFVFSILFYLYVFWLVGVAGGVGVTAAVTAARREWRSRSVGE